MNDDPAEFIEHLFGQLLATQLAIRGMLRAQPALRAAAVLELERFRAVGLGEGASDATLAGIDKAEHNILPDEEFPGLPSRP